MFGAGPGALGQRGGIAAEFAEQHCLADLLPQVGRGHANRMDEARHVPPEDVVLRIGIGGDCGKNLGHHGLAISARVVEQLEQREDISHAQVEQLLWNNGGSNRVSY